MHMDYALLEYLKFFELEKCCTFLSWKCEQCFLFEYPNW